MGVINNALRRIRAYLNRLAIVANAVGTLMVLALVVVMNVDVVARGIFHAPFRGAVEVVIFSMVLIVFLQLPDVVRVDRLTRSDGFLSVLGDKRPGLGRLLARLVDAVAAIFMFLVAWTMWPDFLEAFESCHFFIPPEFGAPPTGEFWTDLREASRRCDYFGTPGILTAPWWPAKLAICFGVSLCALLFLGKAYFGDREPELIHLDSKKDTPSP